MLIPMLTHTLTLIRTYICIQVSKPKRNKRQQLQQQVSLFQVSSNLTVLLLFWFYAFFYKKKINENVFVLASAPPGYPRPNLLPPRDMPLGLHHPDLLSRPYADQLAHQVRNINWT